VGRAVADELKRMGFDCVIVEMNPQTVRKQSELGRRVVFGDISNLEVMESAGIHEAEALILTIPDEDSVMRACTLARALHPGIFIVVRMSYVSQGIAAAGSGASGVVVEEMATAEAMERMIKKALAAGQVGQGH
jgi:CPA2 family monovalent cation:H+ antiporter-2